MNTRKDACGEVLTCGSFFLPMYIRLHFVHSYSHCCSDQWTRCECVGMNDSRDMGGIAKRNAHVQRSTSTSLEPHGLKTLNCPVVRTHIVHHRSLFWVGSSKSRGGCCFFDCRNSVGSMSAERLPLMYVFGCSI